MTQTPTNESFLNRFRVLEGAPRELWIALFAKLLNYAAYAVTNFTLKRWLSTEYGYSDQKALVIVMAWSITMTVVTLLVGAFTDAIGLRRTFFIGVWVCVIARFVMVFVTAKVSVLMFGLFLLAVGEALGTPVLVAAVRKYSSARQRSIAFSLAYTMMNVGSVIAGNSFDWVRMGLGEDGHLTLPILGTTITTYRALFLVSLGIELLLLPVLWFIREGAEVNDDGILVLPEKQKSRTGSFWSSGIESARQSVRETFRIFGMLIKQDGFYRLVVFLLLIAFLKLIFMQMYYVFPEFGIRELGKGAPVGKLWAINGTLIILLVPIVGLLTQRLSAYWSVVIGGFLSAISVFVMALPVGWFQPLAESGFGQMLGHSYLRIAGEIHPYYPMIAIYVIILSFGEAFYSPRVYEYASAIAPKGQEGSYGALSYVPFLLAKLLIGTFSGTLLARYCPATGERHSSTMWLFVALTASIAPVGLVLLRKYIKVKEAGRQD